MATVNRPNRKGSDAEILRLNSVGLSLSTIGSILSCHPTSVTNRLKSLNVPPADTRRTFMEDIFVTLTNPQQEWLADQLGPHLSIKDYVKNLLVKDFISKNKPANQGSKNAAEHPPTDPSVVPTGGAESA